MTLDVASFIGLVGLDAETVATRSSAADGHQSSLAPAPAGTVAALALPVRPRQACDDHQQGTASNWIPQRRRPPIFPIGSAGEPDPAAGPSGGQASECDGASRVGDP